ncbi:hypothetical protein SLA2020_157730 [Shorea laevis]
MAEKSRGKRQIQKQKKAGGRSHRFCDRSERHRSEEVESSGKEREREWGCRALLGHTERDRRGGGKTSGKAQILAREDASASSSRLCKGGPRCYSRGLAHI